MLCKSKKQDEHEQNYTKSPMLALGQKPNGKSPIIRNDVGMRLSM
jgi:hypothetical protein